MFFYYSYVCRVKTMSFERVGKSVRARTNLPVRLLKPCYGVWQGCDKTEFAPWHLHPWCYTPGASYLCSGSSSMGTVSEQLINVTNIS